MIYPHVSYHLFVSRRPTYAVVTAATRSGRHPLAARRQSTLCTRHPGSSFPQFALLNINSDACIRVSADIQDPRNPQAHVARRRLPSGGLCGPVLSPCARHEAIQELGRAWASRNKVVSCAQRRGARGRCRDAWRRDGECGPRSGQGGAAASAVATSEVDRSMQVDKGKNRAASVTPDCSDDEDDLVDTRFPHVRACRHHALIGVC
jgi:hypothetical protein